MKISVIIPVYNEEKVIGNCLRSLENQTIKTEIIVIDDGSTDATIAEIQNTKSEINLLLFKQNHLGPGVARNLGAGKATGDILVFVDADMEFAQDFIERLIDPIVKNKSVGTFSKEEYLLNKDSSLAQCWNLNLGRKPDKMHQDDYPNTQSVFRAILKSEFEKSGGFDEKLGYTDDWTIARKLGKQATLAAGAAYYHRNPETLSEVWKQARWFGKNEFLTKTLVRKIYNLLRYFPLTSPLKGITGAVLLKEPSFIGFKIVYDTAVFTSVVLSFLGEPKNK